MSAVQFSGRKLHLANSLFAAIAIMWTVITGERLVGERGFAQVLPGTHHSGRTLGALWVIANHWLGAEGIAQILKDAHTGALFGVQAQRLFPLILGRSMVGGGAGKMLAW
jgi:hypothetical protein